ncbi:hypothetical protein DQP55_18165 [Mycolicibacterium sp. GF69]|uniref:hypothetical protein n=1 Tax=Mycobacteroides abscessus TaxID=36809 RepID=UPI00051596B9|nr:hypothetical protein [Mycobacteroides abscessus]QZT63188.1 hypothetical protein JN085_01880 [Mycolicibacterium austroafricanum]RAV09114.1 hypothetical protein DQP55_18165 [Mycolicibacterium sp. GF69]MDM1915743.1 hypothetical protein [Mycobacteroides abscessus]MDM1928160.1 hypothetical protein [Mycobacteroides abscessus]MDM1932498.1 hypothetical protein [Mycobacteroides abscessus]
MYPSSGPPGAGPPQLTPPRRRSGRGLTLGLALVAVFMSTAALVVALIGLVPEPDRVNRVETAPQATTAAADSGDQALCKAIEPLIKEGTSETNSFVALGKPGSVERDAGIPEFVEMTHDWASRAQEVLDAHADSPRYLTRTLQRHIDDMKLFVDGLRPGPAADPDRAVWTDAIASLNGPYAVCSAVGVELWQR